MPNLIQLEGNVAVVPSYNIFQDGDKVANFVLGFHRAKSKDKSKSDDNTQFIPCSVWGENADNAYKNLQKGDWIQVTGEYDFEVKKPEWSQKSIRESKIKVFNIKRLCPLEKKS